MSKDRLFKLLDGEITVSGGGEQGRVRLDIYDVRVLLTQAQARRLGNDLISRTRREVTK